MKRIFLLFIVTISLFTISACDSINLPSFDLDIGSKDDENNDNDSNQDDSNANNDNNTNNDSSNLGEEDKINLSFDGYYSVLNGNLDTDFEQKLHQLTESKHTTKGSYDKAWTILKEADEDPNNSNNVICLYTGLSLPNSDRDGSSSSSIVWNREHVWPKSLGFSNKSYPAHNDCHHLHATEKVINSTRGNKNFGEVSNPKNTDSYGNKWDSLYFEPRDEVKGDVARSIFYMVIRYDGDVCNDCKLDLQIIDGAAELRHSTDNVVGKIGDLKTLLKWHYEDPVSEAEKKRNEVVYSYQGNRNPFIDHEEFVSYLYTSLVSEYTDISKFEYLI